MNLFDISLQVGSSDLEHNYYHAVTVVNVALKDTRVVTFTLPCYEESLANCVVLGEAQRSLSWAKGGIRGACTR